MTESRRVPGSRPSAGVIIVNWNGKNFLRSCLASLRAAFSSVPHAILVADNGSSDGSPEMVEREFPEVSLIRNSGNLGFAVASNRALAEMRRAGLLSDYVIFLNNDTLLPDNSIDKALDYMDGMKSVAAVVPAVFLRNASLQPGVGGFELSLASVFFHSFFLSRLAPPVFRGLFVDQGYYFRRKECCRLDWLSGVCMIVRTSVLEETGGFPEEFFMYAEDLALCRKLREKGTLLYFPHSRIIHLKDATSGESRNTVWLDSLFAYYRRYRAGRSLPVRILCLKGFLIAGFVLRSAAYAAVGPFSGARFAGKPAELFAYARHVARSLFESG